jgi:membrane protease YdiL (CAAX protease family)
VFNLLDPTIREIWHAFGALGPAFSAIVIIFFERRKLGLSGLYHKFSRKVEGKLLLLSVSPVLLLIIIVIIEGMTGFFNPLEFIERNNLTSISGWLIFVLPIICFGFFEEIGWRGYLLPRLQTEYNALKSTFILTIIWWLWHIPTFFYRYELFFGLILMFPLLLSGSILITFLYNQSSSLLLTIIFHISYNTVNTHEISIIAIIVVSIFIIFWAIRIIRVYGSQNLAQKERVKL